MSLETYISRSATADVTAPAPLEARRRPAAAAARRQAVMPRRFRAALVVLGVLVSAAVPLAPVRACINGVQATLYEVTAAVRQTELTLTDGDLDGAARQVLDLFSDDDVFDLRPGQEALPPGLAARARRVLALAIVRSGGALAVGVDMSGKTARERSEALAWATRFLRQRLAHAPDEPLRQVDLAEALAWRPDERSQALILLRDLALADLLPEARSWAVLAAVAAAEGLQQVARIADDHCRRLTSHSRRCDYPRQRPATPSLEMIALAPAAGT